MFKLLNRESQSIVGAASMVGLFSLVSRLTGFLRDRLLAGAFGAGETLDAFFAAFKIPDTIYALLVVGALSATFIPLFVQHYKTQNHPDKAWRFANLSLNAILVSMIIVGIIGAVAAPWLAVLIAPGFSPGKQAFVAQLMRPMLIAQALLSASMVFGSALQGLKRFLLPSIAPILYNAGIIFGAVFLAPTFGPLALAWGVVIGASLHLLIQLFGAHLSGYRYRPILRLGDPDVRAVIREMGPRMLGIGVAQLQIVVLATLATKLPEGSVTAFQFASNIQYVVVGTIGVSFAIAAFPSFAEYLGRHDATGFARAFSSTVRQLIFLLVPAMVIFLLLRTELVRLVVGAGAFDWAATIATANVLGLFTISFLTQSLVYLLTRAFFSLHDQWTPFWSALAAAVLGIGIGAFAMHTIGLIALPLAFGISATLDAALLWVFLRRRLGPLDEWRIVKTLYQVTICGLICAVAVQYAKPISQWLIPLDTFHGVFLRLMVSTLLGGLFYIGTALLLHVEEAHEFIQGMHRRFFRKFQPT
ncbi:murein biosynthesis integral membrane protein MurJ, partial [Candidatus Uhrbacteria bacterium]|nr:murein biosynthesis integral membrane protein MurJ [Candidatus Uhrbacteria bacterium]